MSRDLVELSCVPAAVRDESGERRRGSTARVHALALDAIGRPHLPFEEQRQLFEACEPPDGVGPFLAAAHCFARVHPSLTPVVREGELIVGARVRATEGSAHGWLPDGSASYIDGFAKNAPPQYPEVCAMAARGLISPQGSLNHKVVDYAGFIRTGSLELACRAREIAETGEGQQREFALGFAMGHEAMIEHALTYAAACERLAESAEPRRAAELLQIADICRKVPARPAETFHEALQSLWFAYMVAGDGTGRVDVYLNDFYQADLAAGRITPQRALELIECLMIKLHGDVMEGVYNVSSVQTLTLGGVLADGTDACNDLTRLFLQAIRNVRLLRPTVYVRCHEDTPQDVLELSVAMLGENLAEPNFYGDRPIVQGLTRLGVPLEQARDYALSGCTKVVSPGRGNWGAPNGWINLALLVDEAIRDCAARGCESSGQLWTALEQHVEKVAEACKIANAWCDERVGTYYQPTLLMPVCLERCLDVAHGGAETHLGHWEAMGLPNAAEMIQAAEALAFCADRALAELVAAVDGGDPAALAQIDGLPRYGNDEPEVDAIAARLIDLLADALERRSTPLRSALVLGHLAGGENMHIGYGLRMGATLDGRRAGQPLADSLAASQGRDHSGPTALIRSLCRLDHSRIIAGNISTLRLCPADFATETHRAKVVALIRTFVQLGGSQLQINLVDAETLRRAQEDPAAHEGLMVRVAGYSADFTHLGRSLQDEIIARTEGFPA